MSSTLPRRNLHADRTLHSWKRHTPVLFVWIVSYLPSPTQPLLSVDPKCWAWIEGVGHTFVTQVVSHKTLPSPSGLRLTSTSFLGCGRRARQGFWRIVNFFLLFFIAVTYRRVFPFCDFIGSNPTSHHV